MIKFHKTVLDPKSPKQVVQTVKQPESFQSKVWRARKWLLRQGITEPKGLYGSPVEG